jgi:hypothetical protein
VSPRIRLPCRGRLFDLDGTIYLGEQLIPGAGDAIGALRMTAGGVPVQQAQESPRSLPIT